MKNVIVTGASGFIGKYLVCSLLERGYHVTAVIRDRKKQMDFPCSEACDFVVSTLEGLEASCFGKTDYYAFFHLGWGGVNRKDIDDSDIHRQGFINSKRCLEIAGELGCRIFVDTGSRAEYGNVEVCIENQIGNPLNAYGIQKKAFYEYAFWHCREIGIQYLHFRLFSVIGVGDHPWSLVYTACRNFKKGIDMKLGSCQQLWNFMSVRDAAEAMIECCERIDILPDGDNRILNIASSDTRKLRDFVVTIHRLANSISKMMFDMETVGFQSDPSVKKLETYIGWRDKITFEEQIIEILGAIE